MNEELYFEFLVHILKDGDIKNTSIVINPYPYYHFLLVPYVQNVIFDIFFLSFLLSFFLHLGWPNLWSFEVHFGNERVFDSSRQYLVYPQSIYKLEE